MDGGAPYRGGPFIGAPYQGVQCLYSAMAREHPDAHTVSWHCCLHVPSTYWCFALAETPDASCICPPYTAFSFPGAYDLVSLLSGGAELPPLPWP